MNRSQNLNRKNTCKVVNAISNRIIAILVCLGAWGREATARGREDATKAGGGNLHRGRGATAWGREEGGDDATKAGGGNFHRGLGPSRS